MNIDMPIKKQNKVKNFIKENKVEYIEKIV